MNLFSRAATLVFLARLKPVLFDLVIPHIPQVTKPVHAIMLAGLIRSIAGRVKHIEVAAALNSAGENLFDASVGLLTYKDELWPDLHPKPWWAELEIEEQDHFALFTRQVSQLNPQPLPPGEQAYYGAILYALADATDISTVADTLKKTGSFLMKQYSYQYGDQQPESFSLAEA